MIRLNKLNEDFEISQIYRISHITDRQINFIQIILR